MGVNDEGDGDEAAAAATAHHVPPSVKARRLYYYYPRRKVAMDGGARERRSGGSDDICPAASFHIQEIFFSSLQFSGTGNSMKRREIIIAFFSYLWIG